MSLDDEKESFMPPPLSFVEFVDLKRGDYTRLCIDNNGKLRNTRCKLCGNSLSSFGHSFRSCVGWKVAYKAYLKEQRIKEYMVGKVDLVLSLLSTLNDKVNKLEKTTPKTTPKTT